jgi:surfeit locus 1 family protein
MSSSRSRILFVLPYLAGILMCVICVRLGFWQVHRAEYKESIQAQRDASGVPFAVKSAKAIDQWQWRRVRLSGTWLPDQTVFLDNRVRESQTGYHVLTPLRLVDGGGVVVVNRGWVAAGLHRDILPSIPTPAGLVELTGLLLSPDLKGFRLDNGKEAGPIWQRADPAHFASRLGVPVAPLILFQESDSKDGLQRDWPRPDLGVSMHKAYALQWFVFAATALGLCGFFAWRHWSHWRQRSTRT